MISALIAASMLTIRPVRYSISLDMNSPFQKSDFRRVPNRHSASHQWAKQLRAGQGA